MDAFSRPLVLPRQALAPFDGGGALLPTLVAAAGERAGIRFLEFFAGTIRNPHTRRAYARAVGAFLTWCQEAGVPSISSVQPLHVATWIELHEASSRRCGRRAVCTAGALVHLTLPDSLTIASQ